MLLDYGLANKLGVTPTTTPSGYTRSLAGNWIPYYTGRVILELRRSGLMVRWPADVAFAYNPARNLFGHRDGLEYFHAHFLGPERSLQLEPQPGMPTPP